MLIVILNYCNQSELYAYLLSEDYSKLINIHNYYHESYINVNQSLYPNIGSEASIASLFKPGYKSVLINQNICKLIIYL